MTESVLVKLQGLLINGGERVRNGNCDEVCLKLVSAIFDQPNDSPSKTMEMFFISSEKLFSFLRYSSFCVSVFTFFLPVSHCVRGFLRINLKIYHVINCLNMNVITHFVWYIGKEKRYDIETLSIDRVLNKKHFYGKIMQKMGTKSFSQTPFSFW